MTEASTVKHKENRHKQINAYFWSPFFGWPPVEAPSWESSKPRDTTRVVPSRTSGEKKTKQKTKQEKTSRELREPVGT